MKWIGWYGRVHAVQLEDGDDVLTYCNIEITGADHRILHDEGMLFPPKSCHTCRMEIGKQMMVPEPMERMVARGYEPFEHQSE